MNWLASLFGGGNKQDNRRGMALSSTHDAFSLPTSSTRRTHNPEDIFDASSLTSPDTSSYSYPPSKGTYGSVPTYSGDPRSSSLLPLHNQTPYSSPSGYPPLSHTWQRLRNWLSREYPELGDTLNYGITPLDLAQIEEQFGASLPMAVRESYLICDGQEAESSAGCAEGLFFGLTLLPLEDVLEEWRFWREVDDDPTTGANPKLKEQMHSLPVGWVQREYSSRGWIPLITDRAGNYVGVDLSNDTGGSPGQVIVFGREFNTKVVLWRGDGPGGWAKWLASFVDELESGEGFEIGATNEPSDGSEDGIGYDSYFYDGNGRGQGDGGAESGTGGGGLRMSGEYRGWNVMEAWADRSLRRWHQAGIIKDNSEIPRENKRKTINGLGMINLSEGSGAEVAIPVLAELAESGEEANTSSLTEPVPIIAVTKAISTKPHPPLPLDVPSQDEYDALPSPPDSRTTSFDADLETGGGPGIDMREISRSSRHARQTPLIAPIPPPKSVDPPPDLLAELAETTMTAVPIEPTSTSAAKAGLPTPVSNEETSPPATVQKPAAAATPVESSPPASTEPSTTEAVVEPPKEEEVVSPAHEPEVEEATTIRLVGGGGVAGPVTEEPAEEPNVEAQEEPLSAPAETSDPEKEKEKSKHEKNKKSITAGLKNLVRRKDSSSSITVKAEPSAS